MSSRKQQQSIVEVFGSIFGFLGSMIFLLILVSASCGRSYRDDPVTEVITPRNKFRGF